MELAHKYTVPEVRGLFSTNVVDTFADTDDGQAHLNRIAKAITNESLVKRKESSRVTYAIAAFNKALAKVVSKTPDNVPAFLAGKAAWTEKYIERKYGQEEE